MKHLDDAAIALLRSGWGSPQELAAAQAHAADCAPCAGRLGRTARTPNDHVKPPDPGAHPLLPRGTRVDRYLVLRPVGQGGMGVVYAAYDPELDRKVALKLLHAPIAQGHSRAEAQARLLREGQAMARISHPNVTTVHDVGTYGDQVFVAMDLVEGTDLRSWLKKGRRPWRQVLDVLVAAGRGLAAAHAAGLVHRDFKPENVLVGENGRVKVTDFGLARLADATWSTPDPDDAQNREAPDPLLSSLTLSDVVVGTPSYMAPELHKGRSPDARSDQFSFCATLYYALYEKRAFDPREIAALSREPTGAELRSRSSLLDTLRITKGGSAGPIQPPPRAPRMPGRVRRALMRGLALSPDQRFASMDALLVELTRPSRFRRSIWLPAAALVLVGVVLGIRGSQQPSQPPLCGEAKARLQGIWDGKVARKVEAAFTATGAPYARRSFQSVESVLDSYTREWTRMHTEACEATHVRGEQSEQVLTLRMLCLEGKLKELQALTSLLAQADAKTLEMAVEAAGALPPLTACSNEETLTSSEREPQDPASRQAIDEISTQLTRARVLLNAGKLPLGLDVAGRAVVAARRLGYQPLLAEALLQDGLLRLAEKDGPGSERSLREAWQVAEASREDESRVRAAIGLVQSLAKVSARLELAREWVGIAEAAFERVGRPAELEIPLRRSQGMLLVREGKFAEARTQYEQALALAERTRGPHDVEKLSLINAMSSCDFAEAHYAQGAARLEAALAFSERVQGPGHPTEAALRNNLANMYLGMGEPARALVHAKAAIAILEATVGKAHLMLAPSLNTAATALLRQGRYAESLPLNQRALQLQKQAQRPGHPDMAYVLEGLGEAYLGLGRAREAVPYLEQALETAPPEPLLQADVRFQLARALGESGGDRGRARTVAAQAKEDYVRVGNTARAEEVDRWLARAR